MRPEGPRYSNRKQRGPSGRKDLIHLPRPLAWAEVARPFGAKNTNFIAMVSTEQFEVFDFTTFDFMTFDY